MRRKLPFIASVTLASAILWPLSAFASPLLPLNPLPMAPASYYPISYYGSYREHPRGYDGHWRYCRHLRHACAFKHERGEMGRGNCRRYYSECGGHRY